MVGVIGFDRDIYPYRKNTMRHALAYRKYQEGHLHKIEEKI